MVFYIRIKNNRWPPKHNRQFFGEMGSSMVSIKKLWPRTPSNSLPWPFPLPNRQSLWVWLSPFHSSDLQLHPQLNTRVVYCRCFKYEIARPFQWISHCSELIFTDHAELFQYYVNEYTGSSLDNMNKLNPLHPIAANCAREISCPLHPIAAKCARTSLPLLIVIAAPFWTWGQLLRVTGSQSKHNKLRCPTGTT